MSSKRLTAMAGLALVLAGCGKRSEAAPTAIPRAKFVAANVALRTSTDSTQAGRDSTLKRNGVTAAQLHAFVNAHAREPELLAAVWMEVADSVEKIDARRQRAQAAREPEAADSAEGGLVVPPQPDPGTGALIIPPPPQRPSASGPPGARVKEPVQAADTGMRPVPMRREPAPPNDTRPWQPVNQPTLRPPAPTPPPAPPPPAPPER